jgi:hypothetical protein
MTTQTSTASARLLTTKNKVGLVLAAIIGVLDLSGPFTPTPGNADDPNTAGPPMAILVAGAVLGLITLIAVVYTWRTGNRVGARIVAGSRILSILGALPAFFVSGVPAGVVAFVAAAVVLTIVSVVLVLSRPAPQ